MTKNPLGPSMQPTMQWAATDLFFPGQLPTRKLNWVYDQDARILIQGEDQPWYNLLMRTRNIIESSRYPHGAERAAIMTIMNLIPDLKGLLTQKFKDRLSYLFNAGGHYLDSQDETFILNDLFGFRVQKIIKGNLFRALLEDALNNSLSMDQWRHKARLFMELAGPDDWKNRQCWNEGLFTTINWPALISDRRYPSPSQSLIRPDLLSCLCLFDKAEYAECLIEMGYDLSHFLLFNFQINFWRQGRAGSSSLQWVAPFCTQAITWVEDTQKEHEPSAGASEWHTAAWHRVNVQQNTERDNQLDNNEYKALMVLKTLSNELRLSELTQEAVESTNAYLGAFPGLSLPDYMPDLDD